MNFCIFWRLKLTKIIIFRASKIAKTPILELLHSSKLISRKIWGTEKLWNFPTLCVCKDSNFSVIFCRKPVLSSHHKHETNDHFLRSPSQNEKKDENGWQQIIGLIIHQIVNNSVKPSFLIIEFGQLKKIQTVSRKISNKINFWFFYLKAIRS